jgi:uncharacterized protein (DUF736 family)
MAQYDNTNRAALFKNENKKSENHPDYSGTLNFEGIECFLDAWIKTAESGRKFMSLSVKPKQKQAAPQQGYKKPSQDAAKARQLAPQKEDFGDDSIPF